MSLRCSWKSNLSSIRSTAPKVNTNVSCFNMLYTFKPNKQMIDNSNYNKQPIVVIAKEELTIKWHKVVMTYRVSSQCYILRHYVEPFDNGTNYILNNKHI